MRPLAFHVSLCLGQLLIGCDGDSSSLKSGGEAESLRKQQGMVTTFDIAIVGAFGNQAPPLSKEKGKRKLLSPAEKQMMEDLRIRVMEDFRNHKKYKFDVGSDDLLDPANKSLPPTDFPIDKLNPNSAMKEVEQGESGRPL